VTSFGRVEGVDAAAQSISKLGDRLGPVRIKVVQARDDGFLRLLLDSLEPTMRWALDFRHESWLDDEIQTRLDERGVARVDAEEGGADFRYLRLRNPPYSDGDLAAEAARIQSMIAAGLDGVDKGMTLAEPVEESLFEMDAARIAEKGIRELPGTLGEALDELERDEVIRDALGDHIFDHYVDAKRSEWDEYRTQVSDWEVERYLDEF